MPFYNTDGNRDSITYPDYQNFAYTYTPRAIRSGEGIPLHLLDQLRLAPKKAGRQNTRSARLPASMLPTSCAMPWAIAGLIVYLAT